MTNDTLPVIKEANHPYSDIDISHGETKNDMSTYSKFLCIYTRHMFTFDLYGIQDKQNCQFTENWETFSRILKEKACTINNHGVTEVIISSEESKEMTPFHSVAIKVSEYQVEGENQIRGAITTVEQENPFNNWFIYHILCKSHLSYGCTPFKQSEVDYAELFTTYFEENLKNTIHGDEWISMNGRSYFKERVKYFTSRYKRIECILPAFPCKSSNMNKVHGKIPDKGEELAFVNLIKATKDVSEFYPPGMKLWIVSDGHVFSDCIGVDDDVVDSYTHHLHGLYESLAQRENDAIGFAGLKDLFFEGKSSESFDPRWVEEMNLPHYTGTKICPNSELSRQILMKGCDTENGRLKKQLSIPDHPRLHLFRGFSKFMTEDLCLLPFFEGVSRKGFKKTVAKVAFEMIKRNDAYSNLVELIFPHHMRLSIHAHTNSGPKFGVKIISFAQCKTIKSLDNEEEPAFEDLLHIPTPWHNCVIKMEENGRYYLTKTKTVMDATENGSYDATWVKTNINTGVGGHFSLRKIKKVNKIN
ncbi:unnamed protein product [Kluyveromyces dobzhanskii CBS 2104]|uniref:WGS project CCBQ000000000 data, contig 00099 n=1 Tax=Kluyveromyces dobzhanskii CBS 2104 TaxID=1427455 RepID=A0A0A8L1U1_9SACH|nr:unnamed protein product [Kluyveromyces dobzhanskii CBS 2104]